MRKKILIIDNDREFMDSIKSYLESDGKYKVLVENNPNRADAAVKNYKPDLILLDINMPGRSGFDVLRSFKKDGKAMTIPVIMLTGVGDHRSKIKAMELFTEGYMMKPVNAVELKSKVDSLLAGGVSIYPKTSLDNDEVSVNSVDGNLFFGEAHKQSSNRDYYNAGIGNILVVDDEKSMCEMIKMFLIARGFQVRVCSDSTKAMALFNTDNPDIVTLDMVMSNVDGIELLKEIKVKKPRTKVIMLTGINDPEIIRDAINLGADDIIMKPFSMDQLYATIVKHSCSINRER